MKETLNCNGFENEYHFVLEMRYKKFGEIRYSLQLFLIDIFGPIEEETTVICWKNDMPQKFDILIKVHDITKRISLKKGVKNSVHAEPIFELIHFFIENKMPVKLVNMFLKYHYADGTTNGSGIDQISIDDYKKKNVSDINEINDFINNEDFLNKCIDRFIIKGRNSNQEIDAIIHGTVDDFIWLKKEHIYKIITQKKDEYSSSVHFGPLTYQAMTRCINKNDKYYSKRYISQVKWYNLFDDIIECMNINLVEEQSNNGRL